MIIIKDDEIMTPFAGESISNLLSASDANIFEMKPFRNVIKRYWTEEEVSSTHA